MGFQGFGGKDISGISAKGSQLKPGIHQVKITSAVLEDTYQKDGKQVKFEFSAANGAGDYVHWVTVHHNTDQKYADWGWREIVAILRAVGYTGDKTPDLSYFVGKTLRITITEEYLKKLNPEKPNIYTKTKVEQFLPFDGETKLFGRLPPKNIPSSSGGGFGTQSQAPLGSGGGMDDEIPF